VVLVETDEDESVQQLRAAPDGSTLTYFRDKPFCEGGCPASLSIVDLFDDSTTELVLERIPRDSFQRCQRPLARWTTRRRWRRPDAVVALTDFPKHDRDARDKRWPVRSPRHPRNTDTPET